MESKLWLVFFPETTEYLCVIDGKYCKKLAQEIDQKTLFQFWSNEHQSLAHFWKEHGDKEMDPEGMTLIEARIDGAGNITV